MVAELQAAFADLDIELVRGRGGVFTVTVDGREVWNKRETGRFPNPGEIVAALRG